MYAYADPAWATRRVNATKDSATSATAIMPIAYVSGAAGPAAFTTREMLKAAVMLGAMTASDRPTASGKLKRRARFPMFLLPCSTLSAMQVACPVQIDDAARHDRGRVQSTKGRRGGDLLRRRDSAQRVLGENFPATGTRDV